MKFSLVAALVVVLAVAHGSDAGSLVKRDVQADVDKITGLINDMSASLTATTQELVDQVKALDVTNTAQTYMENSKAKLQPLVEKAQAEAVKMQEQIKPFIANIEEQMKPFIANMEEQMKPLTDAFDIQVKPLTDNIQEQVKPLTDMLEKFFQQVIDQTKALMPPQ
ncbi:antifreeze protein type IV [Labrus mixtus]|uniref:antifreeze protein type IV n=1 Tax=Labrus mixtus TaxID=508554 RepID=UPI0029BFDFBE|nr:antifreeze protein type IV [Labrus mixtus]